MLCTGMPPWWCSEQTLFRAWISLRLILGDFNESLPHESDAVGPYTLGALENELNFLSDAQLEIRSKFVEFAWIDGLLLAMFFPTTRK